MLFPQIHTCLLKLQHVKGLCLLTSIPEQDLAYPWDALAKMISWWKYSKRTWDAGCSGWGSFKGISQSIKLTHFQEGLIHFQIAGGTQYPWVGSGKAIEILVSWQCAYGVTSSSSCHYLFFSQDEGYSAANHRTNLRSKSFWLIE